MLPFVPTGSALQLFTVQSVTIAMSYNTRGKIVDYKELATLKLPRLRAEDRCNDSQTLYPVEVIDKDSAGRVKIRYIGYSTRYDGEMAVI